MKTSIASSKNAAWLGIALVMGIALIIRYPGVWFGYPLPLHDDEPHLVQAALRIINTGDLNPNFFYYPTFNIYLQAILYKATRFIGFLYLRNFSPDELRAGVPVIWFFIVGRMFNLILSVLTVFITFEIGRRLFSTLAGLLAALFLTFSYLHIVNSYLLTVDTTVAFWTSLAALMAALLYSDGPKARYYILGGMCVGLAIGSKYTAFVAAAPLLIAHLARTGSGTPRIDLKIILSLLVIPLTFFLSSPYVFLDF